MQRHRDAYRVLQIDPAAEDPVLHVAYRALARIYHPDGTAPDMRRMYDINWAYDQVRDVTRRAAYDGGRLRPFAVGAGPPASSVAPAPARAEAPPAPASSTRTGSRWEPSRASAAGPGSGVLDFGRHAGESIATLARADPDYLRWLSRHSSGLRFRAEIARLLPPEPDPSRRAGARR